MQRRTPSLLLAFALLASGVLSPRSRAQLLWTVGTDDNGWPQAAATPGDGGGANATFVQETGVNAPPGNPMSPEADAQADDDYYFAGDYTTIIDANGVYDPIGTVAADEEAVERAFAGADNTHRFHFNLPATLQPTDLLSVTFDMVNLDARTTDSHYGVEVSFNGVVVQPEIIIHNAQLNRDYTTPQFTLASVGARVGPGFDNVLTLRGINHNADGGGEWMGFDYLQLDHPTEAIPPPVFPWEVGRDDNLHPLGNGGGANASFVQENGVINALPGNPASPETNQLADNDYYFAGSYTTTITGNGTYSPVGVVPVNEEAAERAFAAADNDLRYHFNLPNEMAPTDLLEVTFDALSLDTAAANTDPRYGVAVYVNNVLVQPQLIIRALKLGTDYTTAQFSLASVNAQVGSGFDNIVSLRGTNFSATGGGNWMGIDYVKLNPVTVPIPPPVLPVVAGADDNAWPLGDGGAANASFVQENGTLNALPGSATSTEVSGGADNDYYHAGLYTTAIAGNGAYQPIGSVPANEEAAERGFSGSDTEQRYHFNLPITLQPTDLLSITFDALNLDTVGADLRYGVEIYVNGVLVQPQILIRPAQLNTDFTTPKFTVASVNAQLGPGFDNILTLKGISYNASGGGNRLGIDYVQLNPNPVSSFPWAAGMDDNDWPVGNGGGPNASFVQENGAINPLPGSPISAEIPTGADNDYYFAGVYTTVIPDNGAYEPVGIVLANEEAAERAFAAADNDLRYHFNLPETLLPTDLLSVAFDAFNLHIDAALNADPRYGVEIYLNNVLVQPEILIRPDGLGKYRAIPPFTLASVNAQVGPGVDNILSVRGINYNTDGGGNWMGVDYVQLNPVRPPPTLLLTIGLDDDLWPVGNGGGANATFVQENGTINALPGSPVSGEAAQRGDNDYYFAGTFTTVIDSNGVYDPVGLVAINEESAERAFAGADNDLRYHLNLPGTLKPADQLTVTFDAFNLHIDPAINADPRYGIEVYFNNVLVQPEIIIRPANVGTDYTTPQFTLASVNAQVGPGADNIVSLKGINYNADGGGNWMGIDYVRLDPIATPGASLVITGVTRNPTTGQITLTWNSTVGSLYLVESSVDLVTWPDLIDSYPVGGATGASTSFTHQPAVGTTLLFYRVTKR